MAGLLDSTFDPTQYAGLLGQLQRMFQQPQQAQQAFNTPQSLPTEPAFDMGISNYGGMQTPVFGQPPAQPEVSSQSRMPQMQAPQVQQPAQPSPSMGDRLGAAAGGFTTNAHTGPLGALMGGIAGFSSGEYGGRENLTIKALMAKGLDRDTARAAANSPQLMAAIVPQLFGTKSGVVINGRLVNPANGKLIADYSDTKAPETKEFETPDGGKVARQYNSATRQWEAIPGVEGGGPGKPPAGYKWGQGGASLNPIPGGPATELPAETAGRLAMVEAALPEFKKARKLFEKDWGPVEYAQYSFDTGDIGRAKLSVRTAIEAALRTATGAAAPEQEVQRYLDMYMPKDVDSKTTAKQKLDALENFMVKSKELITQGRSAPQQPQRIRINANGQVIP
jgi:hypothetical protein